MGCDRGRNFLQHLDSYVYARANCELTQSMNESCASLCVDLNIFIPHKLPEFIENGLKVVMNFPICHSGDCIKGFRTLTSPQVTHAIVIKRARASPNCHHF